MRIWLFFVCRKARFYNQSGSFNHQSDGKLIRRGLAPGGRKAPQCRGANLLLYSLFHGSYEHSKSSIYYCDRRVHPFYRQLDFGYSLGDSIVKYEFTDIMTVGEASERWNISPVSVKHFCTGIQGRPPRLTNEEYRKSGNSWLVTCQEMERLYGNESSKIK